MEKKIFGYLLYVLALLLDAYYIVNAINPNISIDFEITMLFIIISCLLIYFGGFLLSKSYKNDKPLKINLWLFFSLYILLFVYLTLFDSNWGRQGLFASLNFEYLKESINLIPFRTIYEYLIENFNNLTDTSVIFCNILGNFVALMPMAFFLPLLFKKQNKFKIFFLTMLLIILGIELLQLFGGVGRFDIDDVILNIGGSLIMFKVLKIKTINNLIKNIFLLEKNKIDKRKLAIIIVVFLSICISIFTLIKYHDKLYQNNLDILQYQMKIVDESDTCGDNKVFYEDDFYTYYYSCANNDEVYAIINEKDKYLVKDLLNNNINTYQVKIEDVEEALKEAKIDYIKKSKYTYITFDMVLPKINNSYTTPDIEITINNKDILDYKLDKKRALFEHGIYSINLHLIPLKNGNTNIYITFKNAETKEIIYYYEYSISIDKDLNVKYEISFTKLKCLNNILEGYIVSEKNKVKNIQLDDIITIDLTKIRNYTAKVTDNGNIYVIVDALDENILNRINNYFKANYKDYKYLKVETYSIYIYNGLEDFNLEEDLKICLHKNG